MVTKLYFYPKYESKLGIDHSRNVDLLQVFEISSRIDVWSIRQQRPSLKCVECHDPDCMEDHVFKIEIYGTYLWSICMGHRTPGTKTSTFTVQKIHRLTPSRSVQVCKRILSFGFGHVIQVYGNETKHGQVGMQCAKLGFFFTGPGGSGP